MRGKARWEGEKMGKRTRRGSKVKADVWGLRQEDASRTFQRNSIKVHQQKGLGNQSKHSIQGRRRRQRANQTSLLAVTCGCSKKKSHMSHFMWDKYEMFLFISYNHIINICSSALQSEPNKLVKWNLSYLVALTTGAAQISHPIITIQACKLCHLTHTRWATVVL